MALAFDKNAEYVTERRRRRPLLRFAYTDDRFTGMTVFTLIYPCFTLANKMDPLKMCTEIAKDGRLPDVNTVIEKIALKVHGLLTPITRQYEQKLGPFDERWYWASLALLDRKYYRNKISESIDRDGLKQLWGEMVRSREDSGGHFSDHIENLNKYLHGEKDLGRPPKDLIEVLARVALASPAVISLRSFQRLNNEKKIDSDKLFLHSARVAMGFRTLFNLPQSISLIRSLNEIDDTRYWENVLNYCIQGNLQSVIDEYVHVLFESLGLQYRRAEKSVEQISEEINKAVSLRTVNLEFDEIATSQHSQNIVLNKRSLRCRFALRFVNDKNEDTGEENRADIVRSAFNSPFRPFIIATTSIGQEGLDFHQYCHEIYHWNLPSNPVDFEQREGRIHRYKSHVIRRNVSMKYPISALINQIQNLTDPWVEIFRLAHLNRAEQYNDLVPYWIFEFEKCHKIYRYIPTLPLSREKIHIDNLKKIVSSIPFDTGSATSRRSDAIIAKKL